MHQRLILQHCPSRLTSAGNKHRHDKSVDGNDSRHDNGDEGLHPGKHAAQSNMSLRRTFMMSSGLNVPNPVIPMPDFEVPYAAPTANGGQSQGWCSLSLADSLLNIIY